MPITFALNTQDAQRVAYAESFAEHVRLALVAPGSDGHRPPGDRTYTLDGGQVRGRMTTRILPASATRTRPASVTTLLSQLPDAEPAAPVADSTPLLDTLARLAAESLDELPEVVAGARADRPGARAGADP